MPSLIFILLFRVIASAVGKAVDNARNSKPQPLCAECFYAHVQFATKGRRAISCTFGGMIRPMNIDVLYCTDYRARNMPMRAGVIGLVREIAPAE
jgi:hypothetical protein